MNTEKMIPIHAAMLAKFKEQGANTMRQYDDQETELATHFSGNNNRFYIRGHSMVKKAMVLNNDGHWIYSDCTTNAELNGDEFWKLDGNQVLSEDWVIDHLTDKPTLEQQEKAGVDKSEINAATALYAFAGWLTSMKEPITFSEKHWATPAADMVASFIELNGLGGDIDFDSVKTPSDSVIPRITVSNPASTVETEAVATDKPVFTQEMSDNGELPPIGCECELVYDGSYIDELQAGDRVLIGGYAKFSKNGGSVAVYMKIGTNITATGIASRFKPIDNRSDEQRAVDDLIEIMQSDEHSYSEIIGLIKAGKIHGVKWIIE